MTTSNDTNTESTVVVDTTVATTTVTEVATQPESYRAQRGDVGPHNIKGLYHSFIRHEGRKTPSLSLRAFAHSLAENGSDEEKEIALSWIANKAGALEKKQRADRQKNKGASLAAIALATKQSRRGKK